MRLSEASSRHRDLIQEFETKFEFSGELPYLDARQLEQKPAYFVSENGLLFCCFDSSHKFSPHAKKSFEGLQVLDNLQRW